MGILSRFTTLMKANIYNKIDQSKQPEKSIQKTVRELSLDFRTVQAERNALEADVKRARQALNELDAELNKLKQFRKRAEVQADEEKALMFANEIESLQGKSSELVGRYNRLVIEEKQLKLLEEKLSLDLTELESYSHTIREKAELLNQKQKIQSASPMSSDFDSYEEELNFKLDEMEALAELRNHASDLPSIDDELRKLEENMKQENEKPMEE